MQETLKMIVFRTIEEYFSLSDFETWLYKQDDLSNQMNDDFILALFEFNYKQKGAVHEFKKTMLIFLDNEEFMLWKIKTNLQDLIEGRDSTDRILREFLQLGYRELPYLYSLGYYTYQLEDASYLNINRENVVNSLKNEATHLLQEIIEAENSNPNFKIMNFEKKQSLVFWDGAAIHPKSKEWWQFWK